MIDPAQDPFHAWLQQLFDFRTLSVRQKLMAINQRYVVEDPDGRPRFHVVRPTLLGRYSLAVIASWIGSLCFTLMAVLLLFRGENLLLVIALFIAGGYVAAFIRILLIPYRDIRVFADEAGQYPVLTISQEYKFGLSHRYLILDALGGPVAMAVRPLIPSIWRRRWIAETLDGRPIARVQEDSIMLALLRRYLGTFYGLLRTNFDFLLADGRRVGEYNRKLTLTDQYLLDLSGDPDVLLDRRVALALGILLDTAEGR